MSQVENMSQVEKPIEVEAEVISETVEPMPRQTNVGSVLRGAATLLDAAANIPDKLGKGDVATKMKIGAAAARALSDDADATIAAGKALVDKSKTMVSEGQAMLAKIPKMKNQDRSHLTRTRRGT